jgi:anti-sigma B factor antagonist
MISLQVESRRIVTGERMVTVLGEIDLATAPQFARALKRCHGKVVVDLRKVPFMDSTGLRVLLTEQSRIVGAGGSLRVLLAGDHLKKLFAITGLTDTFQIDDSIHMSGPPGDQSSVSRSQEAV